MTKHPLSLEIVHPKGINANHAPIEFWLMFKSNQDFWERVPLVQTEYVVNKVRVCVSEYVSEINRIISMSMLNGPFNKLSYDIMVNRLRTKFPSAYIHVTPWEELMEYVNKNETSLLVEGVYESKPVEYIETPESLGVSMVYVGGTQVTIQAIYKNGGIITLAQGTMSVLRDDNSLYIEPIKRVANKQLLEKPYLTKRDYADFISALLNMNIFTQMYYDWVTVSGEAPPVPMSLTVTKVRDTDTQFFDYTPDVFTPKNPDVVGDKTTSEDCVKPNELPKSTTNSDALDCVKYATEAWKVLKESVHHYPYQAVVINCMANDALYLSFGLHPLDEKYGVDFIHFDKAPSRKDRGRIARIFDSMLRHGFTEQNYYGAYENAKKFLPEEMRGSKITEFSAVVAIAQHKHRELRKKKLSKKEILSVPAEERIGVPKEKQLGMHLSNSTIYSIVFENSAIVITENETGFKMPIARFPKEEGIPCAFGVIFQSFKALINTGMLTEETYNAWLELSKPHLKEWRTYGLIEQMVLWAENNWNKGE